MMSSFAALGVILCSLAAIVSAHGYVQSMEIGGKQYPGFLPFTDNYAVPPVDTKITRHIPDDGPVLDYTSTDVMCNVGAEDTQWRTNQTASIAAGTDMSFTWDRWPNDHLGPVDTYMANCGSSCTDFDATGDVWFKIDELGLVSGGTSTGLWASLLLIQNNLTWTVTIPPTLAPGNYLIRHHILALHSAHAPQFYPSCSQLVVTGTGTASPAANELVAIPGIFTNDSSTNIDIWTDLGTTYPIAGPAVTKLQVYATTNPKNLNGASVSSSSQGTTPVSTTTGSNSTGSTTDGGSGDGGSGDRSTPSHGSQPATTGNATNTSNGRCRLRKRKNHQAPLGSTASPRSNT